MTDIVRVWGTCDNLQIEFNYKGGNTWTCVVPPDFKDGVYVAEFWALDTKERIGHWTGFLYMSSGICHFKFQEQKNRLWIETRSQYFIEIINDKNYQFDYNTKKWFFDIFVEEVKPFEIFFQPNSYFIDFAEVNKKRYEIIFKNNNYNFEIIKNKKEFDRNSNILKPKNSLYNRLMLKKKAKEIATQYSAKLGKAILGLMVLGFKDTDNFISPLRYQFDFNTDNYHIDLTNFNYKIFIEERCKHWEL